MYRKLSKFKKREIEEKIVSLIKKYKSVKAIIAHGSFVTRKYFRDIDLILVGKISEKDKEKIGVELEKVLGIECDIRTLDELDTTFKFFAFKNGKILFSRNFSELMWMRREIISEYLDFQPVRKFYEKMMLR